MILHRLCVNHVVYTCRDLQVDPAPIRSRRDRGHLVDSMVIGGIWSLG